MRPDVLPDPRTELIGREAELAAIARFLAPDGGIGEPREGSTRLLTLVGPGGVGKTRLAIEATRRLAPRFSDGACFVAFAPVAGADRVPLAIAQGLGLSDLVDRQVEEQLRDYLSDRDLLLVLDNFEHVLRAAPLVGALLAAAPRLSVLATSRESLRLAGEQQYPVPPLDVPCRQPLPPVDALARTPGVALFVQRARAVAPGFALTPAVAADVVEVVCRLNGLPLAIELAAARVNVLPVREIAARLDHSLRLLISGVRDADPRHQSMRATLDWSYALLTEPEQALLARLAVFRGSFALAAAERVGGGIGTGSGEILDLLIRLVEHSLAVAAPTAGGEARFLLLEVIRQYALERLAAAGAEAEARDRHLAFYLALAEAAPPFLRSEHQLEWLDRLEREYDNLRAARDWAQAGPDRAEAGLRLVAALQWYWRLRMPISEARRWSEEALAVANLAPAGSEISPRARAGALESAAVQTIRQDDHEAAYQLAQESLALYRTLGEGARWQQAMMLHLMAVCVAKREDPPEARQLFSEALSGWRGVGDPWGEALTLTRLAELSTRTGDAETARRLLGEAWQKGSLTGDRRTLGDILMVNARVKTGGGETGEAARLCGEALHYYAELSNQPKVALTLHTLAGMLADSGGVTLAGDPTGAQRLRYTAVLSGASESLLRLSGAALPWPIPQPGKPLSATEAREWLGADAYAAAFAEGRAMIMEDAVAYAESVVQAILAGSTAKGGEASPPTPRQADRERYGGVTAREREVAELVAQGRSNREIAAALVLSERTVDTHVTHILSRLGYDSRSQIAAWAVRVGLHS